LTGRAAARDNPHRERHPVLKRLVWTLVVACSVGTTIVVAQRIITNPKPDAELKQVFPAAVAFSTLAGDPLHFNAYGVDPKTNPNAPPIGIVFWTTDMVPQEHGYHGPIHILVGLDLKGTITGAVVDYHSEPYGYFSVEPPKFAAQFKGKTIRDPFVVGRDVDAVSRASITIASAARAVRDGSRLAASKLLPPEATK
jgi:NosR/NirI family transcriptional regulator, nitrous oxide reductase regulator